MKQRPYYLDYLFLFYLPNDFSGNIIRGSLLLSETLNAVSQGKKGCSLNFN